MGDPSINLVPRVARPAHGQPPLWESWIGPNASGSFEMDEARGDRPGVLRIVEPAGLMGWCSAARKIEPRREYKLEAQISGAGRLGLRWVRIEKKWISMKDGRSEPQETTIDEIRGTAITGTGWENAEVGGVAPRFATHCRIVLETQEPAPATEPAPAAEFRKLFMDGLGIDRLEIQYCQAGYHPDALKTAVIQFAGEAKEGTFSLINDEGKEVLEEELEPIEQTTWGRTYWLADFSLFRNEGSYAIAVEIGGRRRRTKFFPIRRDAYTRLSELTLQWFHVQRCGTAVPDWHAACHLDDGSGDAGKSHCAAGGWHDGPDYDKLTAHCWMGIHALAHLYEKGGGHGQTFRGDLPDALEEARWAVEYLLGIATGGGRFAAYVRANTDPRYVGPAEDETDNLPATSDERVVGPPCDWTTAALTSYSLANFARVTEKMKPELAERCYAAADTTFAMLEESKKPGDPISLHSAAALLCIGLWRARGEEKYREECSWRILSILQRQKEEGIFTETEDYLRRLFLPREERILLPDMADPDMGIEYVPAPFLYLQALICYLERSIDDALALEIRGALDKFLVRIRESTAASPFGQIGEWTLADKPANFPAMTRGHNAFFLGCTYLFAKAALLLQRDDLASIAQRQFEWVLGRNVRGVCMHCGSGHKDLGAYCNPHAAYPAHRSGYQPGGVVNGIIGGDGRDYPIDFPYIDIETADPQRQLSGLDADPRTNAFWMPNCASFMLACGELTKMLIAEHDGRQES